MCFVVFGVEFKYIQIPISTELWKADSLSACEHQVLVLRFDTGLVTHFNCQRASLLFTLKLSFYLKKSVKERWSARGGGGMWERTKPLAHLRGNRPSPEVRQT